MEAVDEAIQKTADAYWMKQMSEQEHFINVKALHEMHGGFSENGIGTRTQMDLDTHEEVSISFTCECGQKFYKKHKAEEHLLEQ